MPALDTGTLTRGGVHVRWRRLNRTSGAFAVQQQPRQARRQRRHLPDAARPAATTAQLAGAPPAPHPLRQGRAQRRRGRPQALRLPRRRPRLHARCTRLPDGRHQRFERVARHCPIRHHHHGCCRAGGGAPEKQEVGEVRDEGVEAGVRGDLWERAERAQHGEAHGRAQLLLLPLLRRQRRRLPRDEGQWKSHWLRRRGGKQVHERVRACLANLRTCCSCASGMSMRWRKGQPTASCTRRSAAAPPWGSSLATMSRPTNLQLAPCVHASAQRPRC